MGCCRGERRGGSFQSSAELLLRAALARGVDLHPTAELPRHELAKVSFRPPIPDPDKIICIGLNYLSHILEGGREVPKYPTVADFAKRQRPTNSSRSSRSTAHHAELSRRNPAVVIGKQPAMVAEAHSSRCRYVAGCCCWTAQRQRQRQHQLSSRRCRTPATCGFLGPIW